MLRNICICLEGGFYCTGGKHFAIFSNRVSIFNKGPLGNFIEVSEFLPGGTQQGAVHWLYLRWASLVVHTTDVAGSPGRVLQLFAVKPKRVVKNMGSPSGMCKTSYVWDLGKAQGKFM